jgi:hypothetical protein
MLTLHISCAYDQFKHLLAHASIVAHITQHHLGHFYTLNVILLKFGHFLHFLLSFAVLHYFRGRSLIKGEFYVSTLVCS